MANIVISDLRPAGSELFMDSESYLTDLTNDELNHTSGGLFWFGVAVGLAISHLLRNH
ncbi:hypothetical protein PN465_00860 [Nodularia spumigena CS-584]|uniref:hypothetical protein n=1 Tax=Nodularia spumigena TaxID=70799 RepID=UPI0000EAD116|nr:hypothetical protein [Nodularia spumigena]EAW44479.1 hypothetical protein N9414_03798 [Nodularia spumigena CCY9414]MDB9380795.1 hypothetical protein [Nodularia spumigena CS-584]